ncbi:hypothetical protein FF1_030276 [Malus domestica]
MPLYCQFFFGLLGLIVFNSCLNGIIGEHAAVTLHWTKRKMFCNLCVLNRKDFLHLFPLHPFRSDRRRSNGRSTPKGLEASIINLSRAVIDLNLELHHVATGSSANEPRSNRWVIIVERSDIVVVSLNLVLQLLGLVPSASAVES